MSAVSRQDLRDAPAELRRVDVEDARALQVGRERADLVHGVVPCDRGVGVKGQGRDGDLLEHRGLLGAAGCA